MTIFKRIVDWNNERGLIKNGFNHQKEISFIIEEVLESTGKWNSVNAREKATEISEDILKDIDVQNINKEDVLDAFSDVIVFATGAIAKLGYNPDDVMEEVLKEIESRTGKLVDGKFVKNEDAILYKADFTKCLTKK